MGQISNHSDLNPNAPVFIPAVQRLVEDFSPEWWELVTNSTWFRDYWLGELEEDDMFCSNNINSFAKPTEDDEIAAFFDDFLDDNSDNSIQIPDISLKEEERSISRLISTEKDGKEMLYRSIKGWEKPAQSVKYKYRPRIIQQPR